MQGPNFGCGGLEIITTLVTAPVGATENWKLVNSWFGGSNSVVL